MTCLLLNYDSTDMLLDIPRRELAIVDESSCHDKVKLLGENNSVQRVGEVQGLYTIPHTKESNIRHSAQKFRFLHACGCEQSPNGL